MNIQRTNVCAVNSRADSRKIREAVVVSERS